MTDSFPSRSDLVSRQFAAPLQVLQPNQLVDRFTLQAFLGEGGMGSVWLAEDPKRKDDVRDGRVVLKFLRDDVRRCPETVEQFKASYRKVQQLFHEHICPLLDLGDDSTFGAFQVMPFVKGMTLLELLKKEDPEKKGLPPERVVAILQPVAKALDYAHREGLIHRDIKPGNIMIDPETGKVFVVDFGLAAEVRTSMSMHSRSTMQVSGTEPYMAPEQWMGQAQDGRSDQYSLAVVAWQMLTGSLPYQGSGMQLGFAVTNGPVPELPDHLATLQSVFTTAMAKDRKQRFFNCNDFVNALSSPAVPHILHPSVEPVKPVAEPTGHVLVSSSPRSDEDDLATLLQKTQESVSRKHAQAKQLLQDHCYTEASEILASIPDHLRQQSLAEEAESKRDRVAVLDQSIRKAIRELRLAGLKPQVEELLILQPNRTDMQRLLVQLPAEPIRPERPALLVAPFDANQARSAQEAWAKHLGIGVEVTNGLGMKFRVIPPGRFDMGSPNSEAQRSSDEALHQVTLTQPKLLGVYPVTQQEWTKMMGSNPSKFKSVFGQATSRFPVEQVSWVDCQEFLSKLNAQYALEGWRYRLPTEAEWEYACRAGTVTPFWFATELNGKQANCDGSYPYQCGEGPYLKRPSVVGSYGANPFGLYDQHGNVWEWCQDWYGAYDPDAPDDPMGPTSGSSRVLRGGSWGRSANRCRSADRRGSEPSFRRNLVGFRVLCELS